MFIGIEVFQMIILNENLYFMSLDFLIQTVLAKTTIKAPEKKVI